MTPNTLTFRGAAVVRALEDGTYLAEALLFPEVSCHRGSLARARADRSRHDREVAWAGRPVALDRRGVGGEPEVPAVELAVAHPARAARAAAAAAPGGGLAGAAGAATGPAAAEQ